MFFSSAEISTRRGCDATSERVVRNRPIEDGADVAAVGEGEQGRPVPGFHGARGPPVKVAFLRLHLRVVLPRLGHHRHNGLAQVETGERKNAFEPK